MNVHMLCSHLSDVFNEGERKKERKNTVHCFASMKKKERKNNKKNKNSKDSYEIERVPNKR